MPELGIGTSHYKKMNQQQILSVLMTAYNREQYIADAIESVLASTYANFELIIVDDCSTDATESIAKKYAQADKRIRLFVNEKNLGQFPNRNHAADFANGEYIMYVDSDDKILPDGFERLVNAMNANPESSFGMYSKVGEEITVVKSDEAIF
jgi:glycosyltransferase involved in cell wall biosynthesis